MIKIFYHKDDLDECKSCTRLGPDKPVQAPPDLSYCWGCKSEDCQGCQYKKPRRVCSYCGKPLGITAAQSEIVEGVFCSAHCVDHVEMKYKFEDHLRIHRNP